MSQEQQAPPANAAQHAKLLHNTALVALIACPALALLPPRKLDFYTFGLVGLTGFSANYLTRERTGRPITQYLGLGGPSKLETPREAHAPFTQLPNARQGMPSNNKMQEETHATGPISEEIQSQRAAWKLQREKEIREDVEEGKGFGDMIVDQIWDVWNWGKPKKEDDE